MDDPHTESQLLRQIWHDLNSACFGSSLVEPEHIGWIDFSTEPDIEEDFGYFFAKTNSIAISHRFQYFEDQELECKRLASDSTLSRQEKLLELKKFNAVEIVLRLVAHEMVHQAAHQAGKSLAQHDETFIQHASGVANYFEIPGPTLADADQWPNFQYFLIQEVKTGHIQAKTSTQKGSAQKTDV
jgi:hypothetical protein